MQHIVGISDMKVSSDPADVLVTYSLGSCVGLVLYDPQIRVGGMVHCMLPQSSLDLEKAKTNPFMFTDTGVGALLQALFNLGAARTRLVAKVAGAGNPVDTNNFFNIGARNMAVLRKMLWKNSLMLKGEDTGGTAPRNLLLYVANGRTVVKCGGTEREL